MKDAVIVEAQRTPVAREEGALEDVHPVDLAAHLLQGMLEKTELNANEIDDVIFGCVGQVGEQALNVARNVVIAAGLPIEVPATTSDRQCGSSQTAFNLAAAKIKAGVDDVVVAGGVEHMTRVPMGSNTEINGHPFTERWVERFDPVPQGISAEMIADEWDLSRRALDEFSYNSHIKGAQAIREGRFEREVLPIPVHELAEQKAEEREPVPAGADGDGAPAAEEQWFEVDSGVRMEPNLEKMLDLDPVFDEDGVITAGNSSQISDGASMTLLMSREKAESLGYEPRARVRAQKAVGVNPTTMLTGPIPSTQQILEDEGMSVDDVDAFEVNEAFSSVVLAWADELEPDMDRVNINGGAIALGHPLGATGTKLMTTLLHELERRDEQIGLQTMCCGGGLGVATIIDREV